MPSDTDKFDAFACAVLLNSAIGLFDSSARRSIHFEKHMGTNPDRNSILCVAGNSDFKLDNIKPILEDNLRQILKDPNHWKKVRTPRGTGYYIESGGDDILSYSPVEITKDVVTELGNRYQLTDDIRRINKMNGLDVEPMEYMKHLLQYRAEDHEEPPPFAQGVLLFGNAAKEIIGKQLGVDMNRIQEAAPRREH